MRAKSWSCQEFSITPEEIKKLVNGKFQIRRCTTCWGTGRIFSDEEGNVAPESETCHYSESCGDCERLGFNILFDTESC